MQKPKAVRAVPINPSHRIQSITPMPQVRRSGGICAVSHSPPPFEAPNPSLRISQVDDIFGASHSPQQPTNISLLSRGISLLSITQLRDLLRDYSLPTGGNKHVLVNRLIIFLETFGQNQQNILSAFSTKLKKLLSVETEESSSPTHIDEPNSSPTQPVMTSLQPELLSEIYNSSPSCLFTPLDIPIPFGPVLIQPSSLNTAYNFSLANPAVSSTPILQFLSGVSGTPLNRVVIQLNGVFLNLRAPVLWNDMKDFIDRPGSFQVINIEPPIPIVVVIKWQHAVPIQQLVAQICNRDPAPRIPSGGRPNGICPLTRKLIVRPARGCQCLHSECFDLTGFICAAQKSGAWQCPICRRPLQAEDLRIDPYFFALCSGTPI